MTFYILYGFLPIHFQLCLFRARPLFTFSCTGCCNCTCMCCCLLVWHYQRQWHLGGAYTDDGHDAEVSEASGALGCPQKVCFGHTEVQYLVYHLGMGRCTLKQERQRQSNPARPQNQKQRWGGFGGLVSCYHRFIPDFIYWLAPLPTCFVSKRINCVQQEVVWAKECLAIQGVTNIQVQDRERVTSY